MKDVFFFLTLLTCLATVIKFWPVFSALPQMQSPTDSSVIICWFIWPVVLIFIMKVILLQSIQYQDNIQQQFHLLAIHDKSQVVIRDGHEFVSYGISCICYYNNQDKNNNLNILVYRKFRNSNRNLVFLHWRKYISLIVRFSQSDEVSSLKWSVNPSFCCNYELIKVVILKFTIWKSQTWNKEEEQTKLNSKHS